MNRAMLKYYLEDVVQICEVRWMAWFGERMNDC